MVPGWLALADDAMQQLVAAGLRPTAQRYAVLAVLAEQDRPCGAAALLAEVQRTQPTMTAGALRRVLRCLLETGLVTRMTDGATAAYALRRR
jgi:Fe2+ or Zn2+ uptake regulation protein